MDTRGLDQLAAFLPRAVDRYREMVADLENVTRRDVARARTQIKALVGGKIRLIPMDGYLEAELTGDYAGLVKLASEHPGSRGTGAGKLSLVAGARNQLYRLFVAKELQRLKSVEKLQFER